ncbi:hypothetical protein Pcar_3272 [Syntrophotalea carbinolica DSM 2380]|uniref:Uncharacterized protein n=1 Tax=Syntrophotalea carbinolica (strain DSM 2380 / NBRC 103641 / GraBd1) TaxID=338963 RepID=Q0C6P5_SYNC1|nr:hypothetical protein [Syntrophotalea carbinolica]ABI81892.1 hypothetical protein Pcar_3272 [Syntrophotalea carbinolica DSM 2380]
MFELLLLIGFLYAGFFPPTPAPHPSKTASRPLDDRQAPDARVFDKSRMR